MKQVEFQRIEIGDGPGPVQRVVTTRQLVQYAGVSGDFTPIHYDKDYAQAAGHDGVILHGALKTSMLAEMLVEWVGDGGSIVKLEASYRGIDYPGVPLACSGRVTKKHVEGGKGILELDIELRNQDGVVTTPGKAVVALPLG